MFALLVRLELLTPEGDLLQADTYNKALHHARHDHGLLLPDSCRAGRLGNFLVPIMIGAKDLAFPRINLLSWYLYIIGGISDHALHADGRRGYRMDLLHPVQHRVYEYARSLRLDLPRLVAGFSSIFTGLNFIVTVHRMRAPGMTWGRLPLFIWAHYATSIIMILARR